MDSLLSLQLVFLTAFIYIRCAHAQCSRGEPNNEERDASQPDLNITSSGPVVRVGDELKITCIADRPRYQFQSIQPMPPIEVRSFFNGTEVNKICPGTGGRIECVHTVQLTKAGNNVV
ncbi:Hypothetical predicted protein, partial [Paramuricea clavata]